MRTVLISLMSFVFGVALTGFITFYVQGGEIFRTCRNGLTQAEIDQIVENAWSSAFSEPEQVSPPPQLTGQETVVHSFTGKTVTTTRPFTVEDQWEVQWDNKTREYFGIILYQSDGKRVKKLAGQTHQGAGASYQPQGGAYYLEIEGRDEWQVDIVQLR